MCDRYQAFCETGAEDLDLQIPNESRAVKSLHYDGWCVCSLVCFELITAHYETRGWS